MLSDEELGERYLAERAGHREEVRWELESRFDPTGIRNRLLARAAG